MDALIQNEDTHMELCRALRVSKMPNARLQLRLGKLDISCLGVPRIVVLLEQLEREVRIFIIDQSSVFDLHWLAYWPYSQFA